jgi:uncharacterized membrane protein/thiol-disulfide isomerase/thioredoxin
MIPSPIDLRPVMNTPLRWAVRVLAWTALGLSAYLTFTSLSHSKVVGCGAGQTVDCDSVLSGQWSTWLGMPVALGGLACYVALATLSLLLGTRNPARQRWVGPLVVMLAVVAGGAGLWFIGLQLLVIHSICTYCMAVHACGVTIAALVLWATVVSPALVGRSPSRKDTDRQVLALQTHQARSTVSVSDGLPLSGFDGVPSLGLAFSGALAVLTVLVVGQVFFRPETFSTVSSEGLAQTIEMDRAPATSVPLAAYEPRSTRPAAGADDTSWPTATKPSTAFQPIRTTTAADDLFAELDQPTSKDDAADLFAMDTYDAPAEQSETEINLPADNDDGLFAAVPDKPSNDTTGAEDDENAADPSSAGSLPLQRPNEPTVGSDRPVMPVSAAGDHHSAATADWRSIAADRAETATPKQERKVTLLNGRLKLDMYQHPVLGPVDAPNVIVELMSYHCPHCRRMHEMIEQGLKRYDGQLAIVEMVVPLEMGCNRYITETKYSHPGSCALTRLSLGVATIDRSAFAGFHDWLLAGPSAEPPSAAEATSRAYQIVDPDRLRALMQSDEMREQIDSYVALYKVLQELSEKQHKAFGLPVQIVGRTVVSGDLANAGELYWTWEKNLGLRPRSSTTVDQTSSNP